MQIEDIRVGSIVEYNGKPVCVQSRVEDGRVVIISDKDGDFNVSARAVRSGELSPYFCKEIKGCCDFSRSPSATTKRMTCQLCKTRRVDL